MSLSRTYCLSMVDASQVMLGALAVCIIVTIPICFVVGYDALAGRWDHVFDRWRKRFLERAEHRRNVRALRDQCGTPIEQLAADLRRLRAMVLANETPTRPPPTIQPELGNETPTRPPPTIQPELGNETPTTATTHRHPARAGKRDPGGRRNICPKQRGTQVPPTRSRGDDPKQAHAVSKTWSQRPASAS